MMVYMKLISKAFVWEKKKKEEKNVYFKVSPRED